MTPFRNPDELRSPEATRVSPGAITRFAGIYEVDPDLMREHVRQQQFPNWDTLRIATGRRDHLAWMHRHWSSRIVSGEQLLRELEAPAAAGETTPGGEHG